MVLPLVYPEISIELILSAVICIGVSSAGGLDFIRFVSKPSVWAEYARKKDKQDIL